MNTPINNGGSAFPSHESPSDGWLPSGGMTLRDYFAAKVMQGAIMNGALDRISREVMKDGGDLSPQQVAEFTNGLLATMTYELADAMLKAREQSQP